MIKQGVGKYQLACEASPHKLQIDQWLNEGKSAAWINKQLEKLQDPISEKSIHKYAEYRENRVKEELKNDPVFQRQMEVANQTMVDEVSKIKEVNIVKHLSETIQNCTELLGQAKMDDIKIKSVQDMRWIQMTLLDSIKAYGETVMQMQKFSKIEDNPDLLRPKITIDTKNLLIDMLRGVDDDAVRYQLIDRLRKGIGNSDEGGLSGDIVQDRSCELDREQEDTQGKTVFIPK